MLSFRFLRIIVAHSGATSGAPGVVVSPGEIPGDGKPKPQAAQAGRNRNRPKSFLNIAVSLRIYLSYLLSCGVVSRKSHLSLANAYQLLEAGSHEHLILGSIVVAGGDW